MKIKKLFKANNMPYCYVVQKCNGEYASFFLSPFRNVTERELRATPAFKPIGNNAEECEDFMYHFYGLEKE